MIPTAKDSKNKPQTGRIRSLKGGTTVIYKDFPEFSLSKHLQTIKSLNKAVEGLLRRKEFSDALCFTREQEKMLKEWETGKLEIPDEIYDKIMNFPTEPLFKNSSIKSKYNLRERNFPFIIFRKFNIIYYSL